MKKSSIILEVLMPLVLGGAILYWMYRGEDWQQIRHVMTDEMDWTWMLLSFPFGILAQMFRGWRWMQTLEPVGRAPPYIGQHSFRVLIVCSLAGNSPCWRVYPLWGTETLRRRILSQGIGYGGYRTSHRFPVSDGHYGHRPVTGDEHVWYVFP